MACELTYAVLLSRFPDRRGSAEGGWDVRCPCYDRHKNGDRRPSARLWIDGDRMRFWCGRGCRWKEAVAAVGSDPREWSEGTLMAADQTQPASRPQVVATYPYRNSLGDLVFEVVRTEPKGFWQRRPGPASKGHVYDLGHCWAAWSEAKRRWLTQEIAERFHNTEGPRFDVPAAGEAVDADHWSNLASRAVELQPVRMVPYHADQIRLRPAEPVFVFEGEKACDAVADLGFLTTCSARGAGKWPVEFGGYLAGRRVVIFPDNDGPGELHGAMVAGSAFLYGAEAVKIVGAGGDYQIGDGEDVYDWLERVAPADSYSPMKMHTVRRAAFTRLVQSRRRYETKEPAPVAAVVEETKRTKVRGEKPPRKDKLGNIVNPTKG